MKYNSTFVLSGILNEKKQVVLDAISNSGMKLVEELDQDIWVALVVKQ
jgi:ribosomal protein L11 methylase PrmA